MNTSPNKSIATSGADTAQHQQQITIQEQFQRDTTLLGYCLYHQLLYLYSASASADTALLPRLQQYRAVGSNIFRDSTMHERLTKLIEENADNFYDWIKIINDHNSMFNLDKNLSQDDRIDLTQKAADVLAKISELYFKYGSFKDTFDNSKMYLQYHGPNLIIKSNKTGNEFHLGIDIKGIYLKTYLKHSENLRYMDDDFIKTFSI